MHAHVPTKAAQLRALLGADHVAQVAGAHDAVTARLAERCGFDALWAGGLGISAAHGVPDAGILTMSELLATATVVEEASTLPVIADCDTGFGDVHALTRATRKYERAGIAAICIEDQAFPKRNSLDLRARHRLAPIEEFCDKLSHAKRAQATPDFVVIARVEAFIAGLGVEEAHRRAAAYADAGADAILIHSRQAHVGELAEFARRWDGRLPLAAVPTTYPGVTTAELQELGVGTVIYANHALRAAVKAIDEVLRGVRQNGSAAALESEMVPITDILDLIGMDELDSAG
jgi:phosphoenolpyruvate phosphomutase